MRVVGSGSYCLDADAGADDGLFGDHKKLVSRVRDVDLDYLN
jgi:hypothetical protein